MPEFKKEDFDKKVSEIWEELKKIKDTITSKEKRKEKLDELRKKAEKTKQQLEEQVDTLKDNAKKEAQDLLDSLNNKIANLKASIWENTPSKSWNEAEWKTWEKDWLFKTIGNRFSEKWINFKNKDWKEKAKSIWLFAAWGAAMAGLISLFSKEGRERRRQRREARRAERQRRREEKRTERERQREERRKEIEALPFRDRPLGKILKWTLIWTAIVWWIYGIKKWIDKVWENSEEKKLWKLQWLESTCEVLKSQAENCLNLSHTYVIDHLKNKQEYDRILSDSLNLQTEATELSNQISASNASEEIKTQAENLKNSINNYVEEIKAMKDEIYATAPDWGDDWDDGDEWSEGDWGWENNPSEENSPESWWNPSEVGPVSANVISQAAIDYIDEEVTAFSLNVATKNKVKTTLNRYFSSYPLLKKWKDNKIVFEIGNKNEFWKTIKQLWNDINPQLWFIARNAAQMFLGSKLDNIDKTMNDLDTKAYEDVIFDYFWWVVRRAVQREWWTMTVQTYYDGISKAYPNKNASQVADHLRRQANKDIKDLTYPLA